MPRLARFADGDAPGAPFDVEILPLRIQQFALACPRQDQHRHNELEHGVVTLQHRQVKALRLLDRQVTLAVVVLFQQGNAQAGVHLDARGVPLDRQVEDVTHDDEQAIGRAGSAPGLSAIAVHPLKVLARDLVQVARAKSRQQMVPEQTLVSAPRPFVRLDVGHVTVFNELRKRGNVAQLGLLVLGVQAEGRLAQKPLGNFAGI